MFHYFNNLVNAANGNALPGYLVYVLDASGTIIPIYSDESGTPIQTVSDYENAAITDDEGNYDLYVEDGTYSLQFRTTTGSILDTIINVPMISNVALTDLSADDGATLVGTTSGDTVQVVLNEKVATVDLTAPTGSGLAGFLASGTDADPRTVQDKLREIRTVTDFDQADATGATDSLASFVAAGVAAGTDGATNAPEGEFLLSGSFDIASGQRWQGSATRLQNDAANDGAMITVTQADSWQVAGFSTAGTLASAVAAVNWEDPDSVAAGAVSETGLEVGDASSFVVKDMRFSALKKYGVSRIGTAWTGVAGRGVRGIFSNLFFEGCTIGFRNRADGGANEYDIAVGVSAGGCQIGFDIGAGNFILCGANAVDNAVANIRLRGGPNHGHGIVCAVQANHSAPTNGGYLVYATDITNGHTLAASHFYGNTNSGGAAIFLDNSGALHFTAGTMDCWFYNRKIGTPTTYPYNHVVNNYFPGDYGMQIKDVGGAAGPQYVIMRNNFGKGTMLPSGVTINDPADVYVSAQTPKSAGVAFANGDILKFPEEAAIGDRRLAYDPTTGLVTIPLFQGGRYRISGAIVFSGTSLVEAGSYLDLMVNSVQTGAPILVRVFSGATLMVAEFAPRDFNVLEGQTVGIRATTINGTTKLLGHASWTGGFTLEKIA